MSVDQQKLQQKLDRIEYKLDKCLCFSESYEEGAYEIKDVISTLEFNIQAIDEKSTGELEQLKPRIVDFIHRWTRNIYNDCDTYYSGEIFS